MVLTCLPMSVQQPTAAPDRFVRLLNRTIEQRDLTLREVARQAGVSIAYLSRLLKKERGLPADKTIMKIEKVLEIPSGTLFDAAGRHGELAAKVFKNEKARRLLRSLGPLSDEEFAKVVAEAERLAKKYHPEEI